MKNLLTHITPLLLILIFPFAIFAQSPEKEPLYFQTYTIEDGLPDNWVRDITQDQQGYMWIATASGISRFDGYMFEIFRNDPVDTTTLSSNIVTGIHKDRMNNIWIGTGDGLNRFERSTQSFTRFQFKTSETSSLSGNEITKLYESEDGTLWIGTTQGIASLDPEQLAFQTIGVNANVGMGLSHPHVTSITESADGRIWIGTFGGGIDILNPQTGDISYLRHNPDDPNSLPNDYISNLFIDSKQVLWVNYDRRENHIGNFIIEGVPKGSNTGLWKKNLITNTIQHYLYDPERGHHLWGVISDFIETEDGSMWISQTFGFDTGLRVYDRSSDFFIKYLYDPDHPGTIPWNYTTSVFEDQFGQLWVTTSRGLGRTDRNQLQMNSFSPIPEDRYSLSNNFYGIEEVGENQFWFSRQNLPVVAWNRKNNTWSELPDISSDERPVVYDGKDIVWSLSLGNMIEATHVQSFEKRVFNLNNYTNQNVNINHFLYISEDLLLVATTMGLWKLIPSTGEFISIDLSIPNSSPGKTDIIALTADVSGNIWLAVDNANLDSQNDKQGNLIARYNPGIGQTMVPIIDDTYLSALASGTVNHLFMDSRGWLWISKNNGLARFDPETNHSTFYNEQNGLPYLNVLGTLEDNQGMIWINSEFGIFRLNPDTDVIKSFGRENGLIISRMNSYSFYKREDGELFFGGVGGVNFFYPKDIQESVEPPLIHLVNMEAGETKVNLSSESYKSQPFNVNWKSNSINLEYISINFRNPLETTYSYKLEGFHNNWVDAGTRRFAQFSNLPPKTYTFHVRAINADGITSIEAASFTFAVLAPWYRTWWAYGFYLILFIVGIIVVDRYQRKRLIKKEREEAREKELEQAKEIEKAYRNLEEAHKNLEAAQDQLVQQEKLASLGQLTAGIAHEIKNPLNFVNNFSEVSIEMIDEIREELATVGANHDLPLRDANSNSPHQTISEILDDIEANLRKIHEHGSRADGIVRSMLMHSRGGTGKMEPANLNALVKEYVILAFHGMRASKNPINVDIQMDLDDSIGEIPMITEDFSRVILNLCNNAFDAMRDKFGNFNTNVETQYIASLPGVELNSKPSNYTPILSIRTKSENDGVTIEIEDNGPGIPDEIKDKILQPFFTTKKGTQGTGLGLSITNDIVKAHGGRLEVKTQPGQTIFTIDLNKKEHV